MRINTSVKKLLICTVCASLGFSLIGCGKAVDEVSSSDLEGSVGSIVKEYSGYLGYGYDIVKSGYYSEEYVNASAPVLDLKSLAANDYVRVAPMNHTVTNMLTGWSCTDILARLSEYSGGLVDIGFKASADDFCGGEVQGNSYYVLLNSEIRQQREILNVKTSVLADYLDEAFEKDIEKLSGEKLLEKYGSYVMTDIQLGGRLILSYIVDNSHNESREDLDEELTAVVRDSTDGQLWEDLTSGENSLDESLLDNKNTADETSGDSSGDISEEKAGEHENNEMANISNMHFFSIGGSKNLGSSPSQITANYPSWAQSVQDGQISLINCTNGIWLWDIINLVDKDKATETKNAFYGVKEEVETEVTSEFGDETPGEPSVKEVVNE